MTRPARMTPAFAGGPVVSRSGIYSPLATRHWPLATGHSEPAAHRVDAVSAGDLVTAGGGPAWATVPAPKFSSRACTTELTISLTEGLIQLRTRAFGKMPMAIVRITSGT